MLLQRGQLAHTVYLGSPVWFTSTTSDPLDGVCCVHLCSSGLSADWPPGHNISKRTTPTKTAAARPSAHSCPSTDAPAAKHHCMLHVNLQQPAADAALPHNSTATVSGCKDGRPMSVVRWDGAGAAGGGYGEPMNAASRNVTSLHARWHPSTNKPSLRNVEYAASCS